MVSSEGHVALNLKHISGQSSIIGNGEEKKGGP
jgi:hypothetical protein